MRVRATTSMIGACAAIALVAGGGAVQAVRAPSESTSTSTYNLAMMADFTGPQAAIFTDAQPARDAVIAWWNDNVGAEIGVEIAGEAFDTRYDAAEVSSLWPAVLADLEPILALGAGGPTVAALQDRLATDEVPLLGSGGGYGFAYQPFDWIAYQKPSLTQEAAGCLDWFASQHGGPIRVADLNNTQSPTYVDLAAGLDAYDAQTDNVEIVAREIIELAPVDVTSAMTRIVAEEPDIIVSFVSTPGNVAAITALQSLGEDIPLLVPQHANLRAVGAALGDPSALAGSYDCSANVPAVEEGPAYEYFQMLQADYGLEADWNGNTISGLSQALIALRAVEAAVESVGADQVTGPAIRDALAALELTTEDLFGLAPGWSIDPDVAPFPVAGVGVDIATVDDEGHAAFAAQAVPVPELEPWG